MYCLAAFGWNCAMNIAQARRDAKVGAAMSTRILTCALLFGTLIRGLGDEPQKPHILDFTRGRDVRETIRRAIDKRIIPGAVFWIEREAQVIQGAVGSRSVIPEKEEMSRDTIFDL